MSLAPLFSAPLPVILHALAALALIPLTITIFTIRRGSRWHKRLGWAWVAGMALVALSSFAIHDIRLLGPFSPIHLLSVLALVTLVQEIRAIRAGRVRAHRKAMLWLTWGALVGAGVFTLLPGRIMFAVVTGGA